MFQSNPRELSMYSKESVKWEFSPLAYKSVSRRQVADWKTHKNENNNSGSAQIAPMRPRSETSLFALEHKRKLGKWDEGIKIYCSSLSFSMLLSNIRPPFIVLYSMVKKGTRLIQSMELPILRWFCAKILRAYVDWEKHISFSRFPILSESHECV